MSKTGYGATLIGAALGSITGIKNMEVGGVTVTFERLRTVADAKKCGTQIPIDWTQGPITLTLDWNKTVYNTLAAAAKAHTKDTFTATDVEASVRVGAGYVAEVGAVPDDPSRLSEFTVSLEPETDWSFTPGA